MSKKPYKVRAKKYDQKLSKDGNFEDVVRVSIQPKPQPDKKQGKRAKTSEKKT